MPPLATIVGIAAGSIAIIGVATRVARVYETEAKGITWLLQAIAKRLTPFCLGTVAGMAIEGWPLRYKLASAEAVFAGLLISLLATISGAIVSYNSRKADADAKRKGDGEIKK